VQSGQDSGIEIVGQRLRDVDGCSAADNARNRDKKATKAGDRKQWSNHDGVG
jgi:hypothetical protein